MVKSGQPGTPEAAVTEPPVAAPVDTAPVVAVADSPPGGGIARSIKVPGAIATVVPPLLAAAVALGVILGTVQRTVAFWDTAEFQTVAPLLGTAHPTGYPTYVVLGYLVNLILTPFGEPAFRMNLFAALSVAAAAGLVAVLIRRLTGRSAAGVAAGIGLAASPLAWQIGTHADPHALHLAMVALLLAGLAGWEVARRRGDPRADHWLIGSAAAFGIAAANHSLTLLLAPAIGLYVLAVQPSIVRRPRLIATCLVALVGTMALLYLELPIRAGLLRAPLVYGRPDTWDGFWYIVLAQQFQGLVSSPLADLPAKAASLADLASEELGFLALLLPAAFIVTLGRYPRYALLTSLGILVTVLFNASYLNADISRYYLGPLLMAWTWLGILAATVTDMLTAAAALPRRSGGFEPAGALALAVAMAGLLLVPTALALPARRAQVDLSRDPGASLWLAATLDGIAHNAVVVSWWSYSTPLWYATLVEGRRPDVTVIDDRTLLDEGLGEATDAIARYLGQRPVYVIRANQHDLDLVRARFTIRPLAGQASNVYEVTGKVGGT